MKATSNEEPDWYWLRKLDKSEAYLRIHWNVTEKQVEDVNNETRTEYEYDEQEIVISIPNEVLTVEDFKSFIDTKKSDLLAMLPHSSAPEQPQEEEETNIRKKDINIVRKELKELKERCEKCMPQKKKS